MLTTGDRWLNIAQAQDVAGVSRRTIYHWFDKGQLTTKRTVGGSMRILESSLWRSSSTGSSEAVLVDNGGSMPSPEERS